MGLTVPAASVVVTIDPTVVASERMNRFNLYDLLLPAGDPVVTLDAAVGPGVGGFVVADGPEVVTPDIIRDTRYNTRYNMIDKLSQHLSPKPNFVT